MRGSQPARDHIQCNRSIAMLAAIGAALGYQAGGEVRDADACFGADVLAAGRGAKCLNLEVLWRDHSLSIPSARM